MENNVCKVCGGNGFGEPKVINNKYVGDQMCTECNGTGKTQGVELTKEEMRNICNLIPCNFDGGEPPCGYDCETVKIIKRALTTHKTKLIAGIINALPAEYNANEGYEFNYVCGWNEAICAVKKILKNLK
jgi:hypothetical protein